MSPPEAKGLLSRFFDSIHDHVDELVVQAQRLADTNSESRMTLHRFPDEARNVAGRVIPRAEKIGVDNDLIGTGGDTGIDPLGDRRTGQLEVGRANDPVRSPLPHPLSDLLDQGVGLGPPASMVDEQDGTGHASLEPSARARSAHRSSGSSMPTERRTVASVIPLRRFSSAGKAAWLIDHG